ncbi:protein of unknown function (DUF4391) [Mariprofundus aestuarium]|uniref:Methyl-accepting chemotaxis protein n=1 Tax=Mariprofundus aestuarium TaxID=1921086 RepID=A0A2K8KYZ9_MARES|nr:DUF4391 domain-containing protein [Mariprofundus aestuarium]ATX79129.1 protein of unknown function (DUF4391) [Mariprofundus aestuarium]
MSENLFSWPKQAAFGRVLPKTKIYEHVKPTQAVKELFVRQVEQIVWQYKLAPETIHLSATKSVPEIQVFSIKQKTDTLSNEVLRCIDQAVQFPIIFELKYEDKISMKACYKRPNEADRNKWVRSEYFSSDWLNTDSDRVPLPMSLDLGSLYGHLLEALIPVDARQGESLSTFTARIERMHAKQREMDKLAGRLANEKQFNRKVEINAQLRGLRSELEELKAHEA